VQLVIFDCDGVLVDSERISSRVLTAAVRELGLEVSTQEVLETFVGKSMAQCCEMIAARLGRALPPGFQSDYEARARAALQSEVTAVAGVESVLNALKIPYCVASNGNLEKMTTTLRASGLLEHFEGKLFSIADVTRGKPAPDLFLHAARTCGVEPAACAVIEDSPTGVVAGVAATMTVYGYCAFTPAQRLIDAGAHYTFDRMADLPGLLTREI
jgi:HAD superfamily hydrolase (TIGR01509 family)